MPVSVSVTVAVQLLAEPPLTVPEVALPTVVLPLLMVKLTTPSFTPAEVELLLTLAFKVTVVAP